MLAAIFSAARGVEIPTPVRALTYREAMDQFGSDKPDRRFGMQLVDLAEIFARAASRCFRGALDAGGVVKAINAKGFAGLTIGQSRRTDRDGETLRRQRPRLYQNRKRRMEIADREILLRGGEERRSSQARRSRKAI